MRVRGLHGQLHRVALASLQRVVWHHISRSTSSKIHLLLHPRAQSQAARKPLQLPTLPQQV